MYTSIYIYIYIYIYRVVKNKSGPGTEKIKNNIQKILDIVIKCNMN